mmetsp:Transcript_163580/g.289540  ORF Transcript_163580/g.289540 Transcript_163580/m.289540 type:complete len:372 (-) Transcript_163580:25-1140(-)
MPAVANDAVNLHAGNELLNMFKEVVKFKNDPDENDYQFIEHLDYADFPHRGKTLRGLRTTQEIDEHTDLLTVPQEWRISSEDLNEPRFAKADDGMNKLALWLAEKREELSHKDPSTYNQSEKVWAAYIKEAPPLQEYQTNGFPLAAPAIDVKKLKGLPKLEELYNWVEYEHVRLSKNMKYYNIHRQGHPPLKWADVLWGRLTADSRAFGCRGLQLAPIADSINHSGPDANLTPMCDEKEGIMWFTTSRPIKNGEELTADYSEDRDDEPAVDLIKKYAMFEGARRERWSDMECRALWSAGLTKAGQTSPLLRVVEQWTHQSCTDPPAGSTTDRLVMQAAHPLLVTLAGIQSSFVRGGSASCATRLRSFSEFL